MTRKTVTDGLRLHRDSLVLLGLLLNLGAVVLTSGMVYGRISATLDRAVTDIAEVRIELREETLERADADRRLEDRLREQTRAAVRTVAGGL